MPLNPVERKDLILAAMPQIANGILSDYDLLKSMDHIHSRGGFNRDVQIVNLTYDTAVGLADKYDLENP